MELPIYIWPERPTRAEYYYADEPTGVEAWFAFCGLFMFGALFYGLFVAASGALS